MPWTYECSLGHSNGCWPDSDVPPTTHGDLCDECGMPTLVKRYSAGSGQVIQDSIPQHWNPAFPEPVNSKQQMKRLQRQFGTSDFEPRHETKERLAHFAKKAAHDGSHRR